MHQVHNKQYDVSYKGINSDGLKRFAKTCDRRHPLVGLQLKKIRDPQLIIIRNKYTKEIVDLEELVGHTSHKRNWRGIIIALVVIIAVCALIIATIILISPNEDDQTNKSKFTFEDFMSDKYSPKSFRVSWIKGVDAFYYRNGDGAVIKHNCSTNSSSMIMDNSTFKELDTSHFTISKDELHAMLPYEIHHIYRSSTRAKYMLYNISSRTSENLKGPNGLEFQFVQWSPDGEGLITCTKGGMSLQVFVQDNDIYYRPHGFQEETTRRVTITGQPDLIYNGIPDWVYEEEVLSSDHALWWSPDGRFFLYASFNDTLVREYDLAYYGSPQNKYVTTKHIAYPKAGTANPTFELKIYSTALNKSIDIKPPTIFASIDHYFYSVSWKNEDTVLIVWLNRAQNVSVFTMCDANNGSCYENYHVESSTGWLDLNSAALFTPDGLHYFMVLPQREGEAGSYKHVAMIDSTATVDLSNNELGLKKFVTTGLYDVISIVQYDEANKQIYYIAYKAGDPTSRHLYRTTVDENSPTFRQPTCISCSNPGTCDWVSASFSGTGEHYLLQCLGPAVPTYTLIATSGGTEYILEDNQAAKEALAKLALPRTKYVQIRLNDKQSMWGKILYPSKMEEEARYHLLMKVYGGPGSQMVTKAFSLSWEEYLASAHNFVIGYVDGRGSAGRGDAWLHANYRHLGTTEVEDTLAAGRYFKSLDYVGDNTAIWGWSYGGYLTASVIGQGTDVFKCGISVAPVTDWRYYDSIYTERYMGMPTANDNEAAYTHANVSRYAANFKQSRYMIVHGTGDDNVHFQNTAQLVRALTEADVYFRSQIYTDQQHSIDGGNSRRHLYRTLEDFLLQCYDIHRPTAFYRRWQLEATPIQNIGGLPIAMLWYWGPSHLASYVTILRSPTSVDELNKVTVPSKDTHRK